MPIPWSAKDPDEEYEYTHDWANRLLVDPGDGVPVDVGDEIRPLDDADPTKRPTIVVTSGDVVVSDIVAVPGTAKFQYWMRDGSEKSKLTATVHTVQGRTYQESFVLPIKQR